MGKVPKNLRRFLKKLNQKQKVNEKYVCKSLDKLTENSNTRVQRRKGGIVEYVSNRIIVARRNDDKDIKILVGGRQGTYLLKKLPYIAKVKKGGKVTPQSLEMSYTAEQRQAMLDYDYYGNNTKNPELDGVAPYVDKEYNYNYENFREDGPKDKLYIILGAMETNPDWQPNVMEICGKMTLQIPKSQESVREALSCIVPNDQEPITITPKELEWLAEELGRMRRYETSPQKVQMSNEEYAHSKEVRAALEDMRGWDRKSRGRRQYFGKPTPIEVHYEPKELKAETPFLNAVTSCKGLEKYVADVLIETWGWNGWIVKNDKGTQQKVLDLVKICTDDHNSYLDLFLEAKNLDLFHTIPKYATQNADSEISEMKTNPDCEISPDFDAECAEDQKIRSNLNSGDSDRIKKDRKHVDRDTTFVSEACLQKEVKSRREIEAEVKSFCEKEGYCNCDFSQGKKCKCGSANNIPYNMEPADLDDLDIVKSLSGMSLQDLEEMKDDMDRRRNNGNDYRLLCSIITQTIRAQK